MAFRGDSILYRFNILSRIEYCHPLLQGAPASNIQKLERVQSIAARIVL